MKTPPLHLFSAALIACFALSFAFFTTAADDAAKDSLPVGKWNVTFTNGVVESVEILADGSVALSENERRTKGTATVNNGVTEILFDDDRAERWSVDSAAQRLTVQHWHPTSAMHDNGVPVLGSAARHDAEPVTLEVHEWGTFTVLQGSNGQVIPWYQAPSKLVDLPAFVKRPIMVMGKSGTFQSGLDNVRMETPVLYFYPEKKMDVTVTANFRDGRITEVFPPAFRAGFGTSTTWHGTLLPPDSPERNKVPAANGPKGRHYAAARDVPQAWLFQNKRPPNATAPTNITEADKQLPADRTEFVSTGTAGDARKDSAVKEVEPIDHFLFYRGAGNHSFHQLRAAQGEGPDNFTLTNYGGGTVPKLFALRISAGQCSWLSLSDLKKIDYVEGKALNQQSFTFPAPMGSAAEVAADLRTAMVDSLHSEGLTRDEAAAMVATWDNLWFTR